MSHKSDELKKKLKRGGGDKSGTYEYNMKIQKLFIGLIYSI